MRLSSTMKGAAIGLAVAVVYLVLGHVGGNAHTGVGVVAGGLAFCVPFVGVGALIGRLSRGRTPTPDLKEGK